MKICHINASPFGGAAKVAIRLNQSLLDSNYDSYLVFGGNHLAGDRTIRPYSGFFKYGYSFIPYLDFLPSKIFSNRLVNKWSNNLLNTGSVNNINRESIDIVNVHWIGNGFLGLREIKKINAIIIFTLHDSWAFTGGCHIPYDCTKYTKGCSSCPQLASKKSYDLSTFISHVKDKVYNSKKIIFVAPSSWMKECAENSKLLKGHNVTLIYNGIDLTIFKKYDKSFCRFHFNFSQVKSIIVFSAVNNITDKLKGFDLFLDSLQYIDCTNIEIIIVGTSIPKGFNFRNLTIRFIGPIYDDYTLALLYSSADLTVVPSLSESLSLTSVESIACGTPVVAFRIGGIPEVISHKINGWLAEPFDIKSFSDGIEWLLEKSTTLNISQNCLDIARLKFDILIMKSKYLDLYSNSLDYE